MERQLEFWPETQPDRVAERIQQYTSLKIVQLVRVGTIEARANVKSSQDAIQFFKQYWQNCPGNDQERFVVACLDTKNNIQCVVNVTIGTVDSTLVHPREVFKPALIEGSAAVILSHNHPSSDPTPSAEDRAVTDRLTKAGELLGIKVLDHIIHGDGSGMLVSVRESE